MNSNATYGANASVNPDYEHARALCSARMGAVSAEWYGGGLLQPNGASWTPFVNATGNPNVAPEGAETYTAGIVYTPSSGRELWDGITATLDWYSIEVTDMISVEPAEVVYEGCLSVASNPTADPFNPSCLRTNCNPGICGAALTTLSYTHRTFALGA